MTTLSIDDTQAGIESLKMRLKKLYPNDQHFFCLTPSEALKIAEEHSIDVAFVDIEMPEINGLELSRKLKQLNERINIIFVTAYMDYAYGALEMFASGYLLKPLQEKELIRAMKNLRYAPVKEETKLKVVCFGAFSVFFKGEPVYFKRTKTQELFAYLVYQHGTLCSMGELTAVLWGDKPLSKTTNAYLRQIIGSLRSTLASIGMEDAIIKEWNSIGVNVSVIECDYYDYLENKDSRKEKYTGEFMKQYSWAEGTFPG